ncbi:MAG: nucleotidyltransferase [Clostridia bacterium]|nr:nucleotidyltransferase [Clostridia bacterium]
MKKPTLLVLAAGMGSRFGGLKQIEPLGPNGEIIIDYSIYDAWKAGFGKVVFLIREELLDTFKEVIGNRAEGLLEVDYAFQSADMVPDGCTCPEGRTKPWGTGHAVWCARNHIDGPFGVINADDFYGRDSYMKLSDYLVNHASDRNMCMVGFPVENTLTNNGTVSRGICVEEDGKLKSVVEHTKITKKEDGGLTDLASGNDIPDGSVASVNVWGLTPLIFDEMTRAFREFLDGLNEDNALKAEFFLPACVDNLIKQGKTEVAMLKTTSKWYGVTYREDKGDVMKAFAEMHEKGEYPNLKQ